MGRASNKLAVIVYAFGETNSYADCYRDIVGVFTSKRAMFKALSEDGMTRAQIKEYNRINPTGGFTNMNIDWEEGRDSSAYAFIVLQLNTHI